MNKKNILIFPCGSEIGLEIYKSLEFSTHFNLVGASSVDDHGQFVYKNYVGGVPNVGESGFVAGINKVVKKHKIDFVFPAHDSVVLKLAKAKANQKLNCGLITSPFQTCEITRSKLKTYNFFKSSIAVSKIYPTAADVTEKDFPIFLKPKVGQGTKGTFIAKSPEDIEFYTKKDPSLLLLEYLPGKEYTVDCFTNKDGKLLFCRARERRRIMNGISVNSIHVNDQRFEKLGTIINKQLKFRGVWFFQVKENRAKELVLMEIAPRVAGTMGLDRCKGVNLALLSLFDAMGYDVSIFENSYQITIDRALANRYIHNFKYGHVYIDFDDLVIFEGKVNPVVVAFVVQCRNRGIKVNLISRHTKNLETSLNQYGIGELFDKLIHIKETGEEKHPHIKEKDAIFIDDSFAERKKIHEKCHIPTFDAHMIEALMEPF